MEQKKTLWIIAAVGAFLLVVLGAAGILYSPAKNSTPTVTTVSQPVSQNNKSGWTSNDTENNTSVPAVNTSDDSLSAKKVNEMIVVSENTNVYGLQDPNSDSAVPQQNTTTIDLNALKSELATPAPAAPVQPQNINITLTLPENDKQGLVSQSTTTNIQNVIPNEEKKLADAVPVVKKETSEKALHSEQAKPAVTKKTVKASENVKQSSKPAVTKKAETKKATPKKVTQYWVQAASYSNKKSAESAREILDSNKISSDIFTYEDNKGDLYFRVRVGPYMTKSEAEYWQTRIMKIPYFEKNDSYITATTK